MGFLALLYITLKKQLSDIDTLSPETGQSHHNRVEQSDLSLTAPSGCLLLLLLLAILDCLAFAMTSYALAPYLTLEMPCSCTRSTLCNAISKVCIR